MNNGTAEDHTSLVAAHHARIQALLNADLDALSKVVGEDLVFISAFGHTMAWPGHIFLFAAAEASPI